ncbi:hypothetical protein [Streptomyces variegatus]
MIAELQQAVANYAHALDELKVPELEAVGPVPYRHSAVPLLGDGQGR